MRYNSQSPCTFRNRITRYLWVLVGAALVATLGLPSAVQAQTTGYPMVEYVNATDAFNVRRPHAPIGADMAGADMAAWVLEVDGPAGPSVMGMDVAVDETDATTLFMVQAKGSDGTWRFRIASGKWKTLCDSDPDQTTGCDVNDNNLADPGEVASKNQGPWLSYLHGMPDAPEDFTYASAAGASVHIFTWTDETETASMKGIMGYSLRWTAGEPTLVETEWETSCGRSTCSESLIDAGLFRLSSAQANALEDGMYTFELTATGTSPETARKAPVSSAVTTMVQIGMGDEGPTPAPTLPEIAALFLAMLLLGSGAYQLRRRQSGGLTPV